VRNFKGLPSLITKYLAEDELSEGLSLSLSTAPLASPTVDINSTKALSTVRRRFSYHTPCYPQSDVDVDVGESKGMATAMDAGRSPLYLGGGCSWVLE